MTTDTRAAHIRSLSRIEGQVRGLIRMIDDDRYCIDIVTQISAVCAALRRVEQNVLHEHISHCVERAIKGGNAAEQRKVVGELMELLERAAR